MQAGCLACEIWFTYDREFKPCVLLVRVSESILSLRKGWIFLLGVTFDRGLKFVTSLRIQLNFELCGSVSGMLNKSQRLLLGLFVLLLVDVIWVSSSELTKYIYRNTNFEKPFFSTYVKTSMFTLYLLGLCFWPPWRDQCNKPATYMYIDPNVEDENFYTEANTSLSDPTFVPIKVPETADKSSGTESDDSSVRSVRFSKLAEFAFHAHCNNTNASKVEPPTSHDATRQPPDCFYRDTKDKDSVRPLVKVECRVRHMSDTDATEALLARLSYQASLRAGEVARRAASKFPIQTVAKIALMFCLLVRHPPIGAITATVTTTTSFLEHGLKRLSRNRLELRMTWFVANYTYQIALKETEAGIVTVLSSTSSLFTLVLAALFPSNLGDRFTLSKLVAVCVSILGLVLVSLSDLGVEVTVPTGAILALVSAFFYAAYLVFLRRKVDHEDKMDIPLFFGFVGLFNLLLLWPVFFLLHYCEWEVFEWPTHHQWAFLLLNGLVGTVLSEVLWLWGCFLTSSLIATIAISLTIPMSMFADVVFKHVQYSPLFYLGTLPMFVAFFAVTLLAHYENWDPVMEALRGAYICVFRRARPVRIEEGDEEQTESLIGINSGDHEA
uniref:Solute carrier family 35 member F5 n=1 Tax=Timema douglasi TaxID=61478 RepID=A0A7R8VJS4_TIMDO|nr:unnamed protein product [Timema douglasi]